MHPIAPDVLLGPLLKGVSRSFYLTLRILPAGMREPVGLAYLLARAADTIADTSLVPPQQRLDWLLSLREQVNGKPDAAALAAMASGLAEQQRDSSERVLLQSLEPALQLLGQLGTTDQTAVRAIVTTLTQGMEFDLRTFPDESSGQIAALQEWEALDHYTYMVAGCVGEFWTQMTEAHLPGTLQADYATMLQRGVRFGKALQMTNVLRDCGKDLRIGRCYLPAAWLAREGLHPQDLLLPEASQRAQRLMFALVGKTLAHFREAMAYTFALPRHAVRLRLACLWPILIGLETLLQLVHNEAWLDPARAAKIQRKDVYRIVGRSTLWVMSNGVLHRWIEGLINQIETRLAVHAS